MKQSCTIDWYGTGIKLSLSLTFAACHESETLQCSPKEHTSRKTSLALAEYASLKPLISCLFSVFSILLSTNGL